MERELLNFSCYRIMILHSLGGGSAHRAILSIAIFIYMTYWPILSIAMFTSKLARMFSIACNINTEYIFVKDRLLADGSDDC